MWSGAEESAQSVEGLSATPSSASGLNVQQRAQTQAAESIGDGGVAIDTYSIGQGDVSLDGPLTGQPGSAVPGEKQYIDPPVYKNRSFPPLACSARH